MLIGKANLRRLNNMRNSKAYSGLSTFVCGIRFRLCFSVAWIRLAARQRVATRRKKLNKLSAWLMPGRSFFAWGERRIGRLVALHAPAPEEREI
jgi:hypothetical protein